MLDSPFSFDGTQFSSFPCSLTFARSSWILQEYFCALDRRWRHFNFSILADCKAWSSFSFCDSILRTEILSSSKVLLMRYAFGMYCGSGKCSIITLSYGFSDKYSDRDSEIIFSDMIELLKNTRQRKRHPDIKTFARPCRRAIKVFSRCILLYNFYV